MFDRGGIKITIKKEKKDIAENIVYQYLKNTGNIIIEKNFKYKKEKIDLIVYDEKNKELVFIEIKMVETIKELKNKEEINQKDELKATAKYYNHEYGIQDIPVRFDLIKIILNNSMYKIKHIKNIFYQK